MVDIAVSRQALDTRGSRSTRYSFFVAVDLLLLLLLLLRRSHAISKLIRR